MGWGVQVVSVNIEEFKTPVQIFQDSYVNWLISHFLGEKKAALVAYVLSSNLYWRTLKLTCGASTQNLQRLASLVICYWIVAM